MSLNKTQLEQVNQSNFPNNNAQFITPEKLREFNTDMIDAIVISDATASFARTDVANTFTANQTITGDLNVSGVISASVLYVQTETSSVIFSSGSNQFGDDLSDIQTLSGSVKVQGSLTVNGVPVLTGSVSVDTGSLVTTASFNAYTQSNDARVTALENNTASANIAISNLNIFTSSANVSIGALNAFTQSQTALNGTFATTGSNTFTGNQVIDRANKLYTNGIYWNDPTAGFNNLEIINMGGGNLDFASLNGGRMRIVSTPILLTGSVLTSLNDISTSANIYAANLTGSTIDTGSFATTGSNTFYGNQTINGDLFASGALSEFWINGNAGYASVFSNNVGSDVSFVVSSDTGSLTMRALGPSASIEDGGNKWWYAESDGQGYFSSLKSDRDINIAGTLTASLQEGYVWVGDGNGISTIVATSSFGGGSPINTGSFATTGSNTFRGSQTINVQGSNNEFNLISDNQTNINFQSAGSNFTAYGDFAFNNNGQYGGSGSVKFLARNNDIIFAADGGFQLGQTNGIGNGIGSGYVKINVPTGSSQLQLTGSLNVSDTFTASIQQGYVWVGDANGRTYNVATSSFGGGVSGNFATTGSNTFTGVNTFNERTSLQGINVYTGSASGIYIGDRTNFAPTTAGNIPGNAHTVVGNGALGSFGNGDLNAAFGPNALASLVSGSSNMAMGGFAGFQIVNGLGNTFIGDQAANGLKGGDYNFILGSSAGNALRTGSFNVMIGVNTGGQLATGSGNFLVGPQGGGKVANNVDAQFAINYGTDISPRRLLYKSGSEAANLGLYGGLEVERTFTASIQEGYTWVGDSTGYTVAVPTSSFGGGTTFAFPSVQTISGSFLLTANGFTSGAANLLHITGSTPNTANLIFKNNNNAGTTFVNTGSNNIFTNPSAPTGGRINYVGGNSNIFLNSNRDSTITVGLPTITGSSATVSGTRPFMNANILLGSPTIFINQSSTPGTHFYNNNIFAGAMTVNAMASSNAGGNPLQNGRLDFTANNVFGTVTLNMSSRSLAQSTAGETGSARASITNNVFNGTFTYNGPVSASSTGQVHTITNNTIAGTFTMNAQSGSKAYSVTNNNINGTLTFNDNAAFTPTLGSSVNFTQNIINGTATFNSRNSASFNVGNNNINTWTISSDADASAITNAANRQSNLSANALFGSPNNNILYSGSAVGSTTKVIQANLMAGSNISASVGGGEQGLVATAVLGNGLTVFGTNLFNSTNNGVGGANNGSLFAGRWNVNELPRAGTAETVFAIGTGTSGSAGVVRKTGFLIDSGSNTFIEGTLNVSGASTLNGNLTITGSLTASLANGFTYVGNASGITTAVETGSIVVATASFATSASDIVVTVKNTTGAQINKGTVVRITGATGDNALIGTASWEDDNNSANTLGFVVTDIPNDAFGRVMTQGTLLSINTDPTLGYTAGQIVYLSGSGQYTNIKPPAPYHEVRLGQVLRAQQNNGSIYVLIQNGYELGELHDVDILTGSLANNDLLAYNSSSTQWENKSFGVLGLAITGSNSFQGVQNITGSLIVSASAGQSATAYEMVPATNAFFVYNYTEEFPGHEVYINAQTATGSISVKAYDTHTAITDTSGQDAIRFELDGTSGVSINQPLFVTGAVTISDVISLAQLDPLPAGTTGQLAVSQSLLWFYDATDWKQVSLL